MVLLRVIVLDAVDALDGSPCKLKLYSESRLVGFVPSGAVSVLGSGTFVVHWRHGLHLRPAVVHLYPGVEAQKLVQKCSSRARKSDNKNRILDGHVCDAWMLLEVVEEG